MSVMLSDSELSNRIEDLVDNRSLSSVLSALAEMCREKAEHLRVTWQDPTGAKAWDRCAIVIDRAAAKAEKERV